MKFSITLHSRSGGPPDALDLLFEQLGPRRGGARFSRGAAEIRVSWDEDAPVSMERDERAEIGRIAVLEILGEVCDRTPGLKLDWYAVSARAF